MKQFLTAAVFVMVGLDFGSTARAQSTISLSARTVVKLLPDPAYPYIYGLNRGNGVARGTLFRVGVNEGGIDSEIPLGIYPTDMALGPEGDAVYVINAGSAAVGSMTISKVNLDTFSVVSTQPFSPLGPQSSNPIDGVHLAVGRGGRLFFTYFGCTPGIRTFDFDRGLQTGFFNDANGAQGLALSRDDTTLYRYASGLCPLGTTPVASLIGRLTISTNGTLSSGQSYNYSPPGTEGLPIMMDDAERWIFCGKIRLSTHDLAVPVSQFPEEIFATTRDGAMAFGGSKVFNVATGGNITNLSGYFVTQCLSGDQEKLFRYNPTNHVLKVYNLADIVGAVESAVAPVDGLAVSPPITELSWTPVPLVSNYDVYFGIDREAVTSATTESHEYVGRTGETHVALSVPVVANATYYWRVDSVTSTRTNASRVWSFTVSPLNLDPRAIRINATNGFNPSDFPLGIGGSGASSWSALVKGGDWLSIDQTAGTTPSILTASFKTAGLAPGLYTNQIELSVDGAPVEVPVIVDVVPVPFRLSGMVADRTRHVIYALGTPRTAGEQVQLLFINTDSGEIAKTLPLGLSGAGAPAVHDADDKIFIIGGASSNLVVVDLKTQSLLPSLHLDVDPTVVSTGPLGRIVVQYQAFGVNSDNQPVPYYATGLFDSMTGLHVADITSSSPFFGQFGYGSGGASDRSGAYYYDYWYDIGLSGPESTLSKIELSGDHPVYVAEWGGDTVTHSVSISQDGSRIFWYSGGEGRLLLLQVLDNNLRPVAEFNDSTIACSTDGSVAVTEFGKFIATANAKVLFDLGVQLDSAVVDGQNNRCWYYDQLNRVFGSVSMMPFAGPRVTSTSPAVSSVPESGAVQLSATVDGIAPFAFQWRHEGTNLPGATNLVLSLANIDFSQNGSYQLVASNQFGPATGAVMQVNVLSPPTITDQPRNSTILAGQTLNLSVRITGSPPFICQWWLGNSVVPGMTDTNLSMVNAQIENGGLYHVVVSNMVGSVTSSPAIVRIGPAAPSILEDPVSQVTHASDPAMFKVAATGSQPLRYQWLFNGTPLTGATTTQIQIVDSQAGNIGGYSVIVTNALGSITSAVARLDVTPQVPIFSTQPHGAVVSIGGGFSMVGTVVGTEPFAFQWIHNGTNLPGAIRNGLNIPNASLADAGTYTLLASNSVGTNWSEPAIVSLVSSPQLVQKPASSVWDTGATVTMSATASGIPEPTFEWSKEGTPGILGTSSTLTLTNVQATQTGYYTVQAVNPYGLDSTTFRMSVLGPQSRIVSWGDNSSGQTNVPPSMLPVVSIVGGDSHSVALLRDGTIRAWGANDFGQATVPQHSTRFVSIAAGAFHNLAIDADGVLVAWGRNESGQTNIPKAATTDIVAVAAGEAYSMALRADGQIEVWGDGSNGLGTPPAILTSLGTTVRAIAAGGAHCLALLDSGTVVGWGLNASGQTVSPRTAENVVAIAAGQSHSVALRSDGIVIAWGDNSLGQTTVPAGLSNVVAIAAGAYHTLALRSDGTVAGWGNDGYGQLDVPVGLNSVASISSGYYHALALVPFTTIRARLTSVGYVLDWPGQGVLEAAPTLFGPWNPVGANGNSFTNLDMAQSARFFRLVQ